MSWSRLGGGRTPISTTPSLRTDPPRWMLTHFLPQEVRKAFSWTDFRTGAPHGHDAFLCLPRGALPDPATRAAIAAWAQRPLEEWDLCEADFASFCRTRLVLCSSHWPRMHPLLPTQPPEALDEATVEAYVARLRDAADDSARPTALLFEMQADVHLQSAYMILDGHHKVEALRCLSRPIQSCMKDKMLG